MPGIKALRKIEMGRESSMGTAVASSTVWRGIGTLKDDQELMIVKEDVGIVAPTDRVYVPKLYGQLEMEEIEATFEQMIHIFEAGIKTVTPSQDGAGTDYISAYPMSISSQNTLKAYTLEGGDDQQAEEMEYCLVESFSISGVVGEAMKMSATWFGRQVANSTFTGSSLPTVEEILFGKTKLYIDAGGGTIGSTQVSSTLLGMSLDVVTGVIPVWAADGNLYFSTHKISGDDMEVKLSMTYEHNASAVTEKGNYRGPTKRLVRLETEGSAAATAGTTYTYKTLLLDLAGYYSDWSKLGEQNGNDVYEVEFTGLYSSGDSLYFQPTVVHELSAVP